MIALSVDSVAASMTRLSGPSRLKMEVFWLSREAGSLSFWVKVEDEEVQGPCAKGEQLSQAEG